MGTLAPIWAGQAEPRAGAAPLGAALLGWSSLTPLSRGLEVYWDLSLSSKSATSSWAADLTLDSIARDLAS